MFTSTCRSPKASTAVLTRFSPPSQSATSSWFAIASPPKDRDLLDHLLGGRRRLGLAVQAAAEVVHHDLGALCGEQERVLASDAPPRAGDDRHAAVQCTHHCLLDAAPKTTEGAARPPEARRGRTVEAA